MTFIRHYTVRYIICLVNAAIDVAYVKILMRFFSVHLTVLKKFTVYERSIYSVCRAHSNR